MAGGLWTWRLDPLVTVTAVVGTGCYLLLTIRSPARLVGTRRVSVWKILAFCSGMAVYLLAFGSRLDQVADTASFAVHMLQHMLEVVVMVPLWLVGTEPWMVRPLARWRVFAVMTDRFAGLVGFGVIFNLFHWPWLYDLTLRSEPFHFVEHLLFFVLAVCLWWPVLSPLPEYPGLSPGWRMLYLVSAMNLMMPVSVYLLISRVPWYAYPYLHDPDLAALGLTPLADQQWGGLIMLVMSGLAFATAFSWSYGQFDETAGEPGTTSQ